MKKELTGSDIEKLYTFLQRKYVDTYDIQTELVDHLASDIELQWEKNPDLTFEEAMLKVYKKFGIFGFMDVYGQRVAAIKREIRMHWLRTFFKFFKLPYLLFFIVLFMGFQQALTSFGLDMVMIFSLGILYMAILYFALKEFLYTKRNLLKKLSVMQYNQGFVVLFYFPMYFYLFVIKIMAIEVLWPYALYLTVCYILTIAYIHTVDKIKQKAKEQYPSAFA